MSLKHLFKLLTGRLDVSNRAKLTPRNLWAVLQASFRKLKKKASISGFSLPQHQWEQIVWRRTEVRKKSYQCWRKGYCTHCGCEILGKTMEDRGCKSDKACYPSMMDKATWNQYKIDNNIKLFE